MKNYSKYAKKSALEQFQYSTRFDNFNEFVPEKDWPESWKTIHYKQYPRLPHISLPAPHLPNTSLLELLNKRASERTFSKALLSLGEISSLLHHSVGIRSKNASTRFYPSAGKRYPLETYILNFSISDLPSGLYHYNLQQRSLVSLFSRNFSTKISQLTGQQWTEDSHAMIILSAVFGRSSIKYSDRSLRYCYIEAGHIAQNIHLVATALDVKSCSIGGFIDQKMNEILDIDSGTEAVLSMIAIGK